MSLFGLRPEEPAAIRIREAATRGTLSHALLLTGSGDRMSAACFAAAALECTGEESRPCGVCPACRKVLAGIHPDVITVRDPDHIFGVLKIRIPLTDQIHFKYTTAGYF